MPDFFILGAPRSGTTLVRTIVDGHTDVSIPAETHFFPWLVKTRALAAHPVTRRRWIQLAFTNGALQRSGFDFDDVVRRVGSAIDSGHTPLEAFDMALRSASGVEFLGDKTPAYTLNASKLLQHYPEASVIWVRRQRSDVIASLLRMPWGPDDPAAAAHIWDRCAAELESVAEHRDLVVIDYEELVDDPEKHTKRICAELDIDFQQRMLDVSERAAEATALHNMPSGHERLNQAISRPERAADDQPPVDVQASRISYIRYRAGFLPARVRTLLRLLGKS